MEMSRTGYKLTDNLDSIQSIWTRHSKVDKIAYKTEIQSRIWNRITIIMFILRHLYSFGPMLVHDPLLFIISRTSLGFLAKGSVK